MLEIRGVSELDAFAQRNLRSPAQFFHPTHIEQFARRAVRLAVIEHEFAIETDNTCDGLGKFADGKIVAAANVDQRGLAAF